MDNIQEGIQIKVSELLAIAKDFATREAKTLPELASQTESARRGRAHCGSAYIGADATKGIIKFRTRCPGKDPRGQVHQTWEQRVLFFLWLDDIKKDPEKYKAVSWPQYLAENKGKLRESDVLADCSCPDFKFMGGYAIGEKEGWAFDDAPSIAYTWPSKKNPSGVGGVCKHLLSASHSFL